MVNSASTSRVRAMGSSVSSTCMSISASNSFAISNAISICRRLSAGEFSLNGMPPTTSTPRFIAARIRASVRFYDSLLRKGDDLDIDQIAKPFAGADQAFGRSRAADRIDIHMGAQSGDAVFQRTAEHARRPIGDFIHGVIALDIPEDLDRPREW